jgi:hypothetical protein
MHHHSLIEVAAKVRKTKKCKEENGAKKKPLIKQNSKNHDANQCRKDFADFPEIITGESSVWLTAYPRRLRISV